jgi:GAF domain-containing protein
MGCCSLPPGAIVLLAVQLGCDGRAQFAPAFLELRQAFVFELLGDVIEIGRSTTSAGPPPARTRDGPCINAAKHQSIFRIEDTGRDERWPELSAEAARLKVRSMLCVPL